MDPTRIDPKKSARPTLLKSAAAAQGGAAAKAQGPSSAAASATEVATSASVSVQTTGLAEAKLESKRIDARRFEELREAIKNDTYKVDIGGLARLMVEDALGPESAE
jgi:anti-sigma28 factor (negative regulator of flagellin synthesis)